MKPDTPMTRRASSRFMRANALFLVAFHALAVSRSLIPGLCATQTAFADRDACRIVVTEDTVERVCCPGTEKTPDTVQADAPEGIAYTGCGFCSLVCTAATPGASPALAWSPAQTDRPSPLVIDRIPQAEGWNPASPRAPPAQIAA